jgi:hypothetical protein
VLRHFFYLLVLSVLAILFLQYIIVFSDILLMVHKWIVIFFTTLFATIGDSDKLISNVLALVLVPILISMLVSGIYWLIYRRAAQYSMSVAWVVWLILVLNLAAKL